LRVERSILPVRRVHAEGLVVPPPVLPGRLEPQRLDRLFSCFGFRVEGLGFGVSGFGFRVWKWGFRI